MYFVARQSTSSRLLAEVLLPVEKARRLFRSQQLADVRADELERAKGDLAGRSVCAHGLRRSLFRAQLTARA